MCRLIKQIKSQNIKLKMSSAIFFICASFLFLAIKAEGIINSSCELRRSFKYGYGYSCSWHKNIPTDIDGAKAIFLWMNNGNNALEKIPSGIILRRNLTNLRWLNLAECEIREIENGAFNGGVKIEKLDLDKNKIEVFDPLVLNGLIKLKELSICGNPLKQFSDGAEFPNLVLVKLYMRQCQLRSIDKNLFKNLQKLEILSLSESQLQSLDWQTFEPLKTLNQLWLENNPWHCDCHILFLREFLRENGVKCSRMNEEEGSRKLQCNNPSHLAGMKWTEIAGGLFVCPPEITNLTQLGTYDNTVYNNSDLVGGTVNKTVQLECIFNGFPPPEVTWKKDGMPVLDYKDNSTSKILIETEEDDESEFRYKFIQNLLITKPEVTDKGSYECHISNLAGKASRFVFVDLPDDSIPGKIVDWREVEQKSAPDLYVRVGLFSFIALLAIALIILSILYVRYKRNATNVLLSTIKQFRDGSKSSSSPDYIRLPYDSAAYEIPKSNFKITKAHPLGNGAFGDVFKETITVLSPGAKGGLKSVEAAVKTTKDDCDDVAVKGLLSEIKILSYLGKHPNIVRLVGAYTAELEQGKIYCFLEMCSFGSLESYLRKCGKEMSNEPIDDFAGNLIQLDEISPGKEVISISLRKDLLQWSLQIVEALVYIAEMNIVHGDIATRNVLLTADRTAKVSDFGLARRLNQYQVYKKKKQEPLPWKWMAPEALQRLEFTEKSDVWSFGVTLWEIYSLGDVPYAGA